MVAHIYNFLIWEAKEEGYCEFQEGLKKVVVISNIVIVY